MIKIATKINNSGWRYQAIINLTDKTINSGTFLFHGADISDLTKKQFNSFIEAFKAEGFKEVE